jgi:hypothetical protein
MKKLLVELRHSTSPEHERRGSVTPPRSRLGLVKAGGRNTGNTKTLERSFTSSAETGRQSTRNGRNLQKRVRDFAEESDFAEKFKVAECNDDVFLQQDRLRLCALGDSPQAAGWEAAFRWERQPCEDGGNHSDWWQAVC